MPTKAPATEPEPQPVEPQPVEHRNLALALAAFQAHLPQIAKGNTARIPGKEGKSGYTYDYADLTDVSAAVLPALAAQGLAWVTMVNNEEDAIVLSWMLVHGHSDERLEGSVPVGRKGQSWQDLGGSITYARRYCLVAVTGVAPGGDDNDGAGAHAGTDRQERPPRPSAPIAVPAEPLPAGLYDLGSVTTRQEAEQMFYAARGAGHLNLVIGVPQDDGSMAEVPFGSYLRELGNSLATQEHDDAEEAERAAVAAHEAELAAQAQADEARSEGDAQ